VVVVVVALAHDIDRKIGHNCQRGESAGVMDHGTLNLHMN
jgi:hypothetical protein